MSSWLRGMEMCLLQIVDGDDDENSPTRQILVMSRLQGLLRITKLPQASSWEFQIRLDQRQIKKGEGCMHVYMFSILSVLVMVSWSLTILAAPHIQDNCQQWRCRELDTCREHRPSLLSVTQVVSQSLTLGMKIRWFQSSSSLKRLKKRWALA